MSSIYAIVFKDTKEILTAESFRKFWKSYGSNNLCGWRFPKKLYFTEGKARAGFSHIPSQLKEKVEIARFDFAATVQDGAELAVKQKEKKEKREKCKAARTAAIRLENARRALEEAEKNLKKLQ
jgi:hypothetical protein